MSELPEKPKTIESDKLYGFREIIYYLSDCIRESVDSWETDAPRSLLHVINDSESAQALEIKRISNRGNFYKGTMNLLLGEEADTWEIDNIGAAKFRNWMAGSEDKLPSTVQFYQYLNHGLLKLIIMDAVFSLTGNGFITGPWVDDLEGIYNHLINRDRVHVVSIFINSGDYITRVNFNVLDS